MKLFAQINENGLCVCIGTPETEIEVLDYSNLGKRRIWVETYHDQESGIDILNHWEWQDVPPEPVPMQPNNAEVAQMISDLQADLIIAGVIE